ncbi:MAG: 2-oxoglutarate oxidoreductase [Synergistaceae bacterium]|nr:2-oxoglutarate oxidoreductase [Synergistaceae bacterium]
MPKVWNRDVHTHYCPGCTHGVAHRLVCEAIDELGIQDRTIGIAPVGCAVLMHQYLDLDMIEAAHGRAPALATGAKVTRPDKVVFTYQGDGDLASIGMAEIVHAINRGLPITIVFINNAIYGMTGGQMAPTTLIGQKSTTSPNGRDPKVNGYPIRMCELLTTLASPAYIERCALSSPKYILKAKQAVLKAFRNQVENKGVSFVELLSTCPTNWGKRPTDACKWLEDNMIPYYPLGVYKDLA